MTVRTHTLAAAFVAAAAIISLEVVEARNTCYLGGHLYNRNRQIEEGGIIDAECPHLYHSAPFGNWGVHSRFGGLTNKYQFAGWAPEHWSQLHWNSCTWHPEFDAPHPLYYNRPTQGPRVWQETVRGEERVNSAWFDRGRSGQTCRDRWDGNVYSFNNLQIRLWELDWDGNDKVGTMYLGDVRIRLSCDSDWDCDGDSNWFTEDRISPSNTRVTAQHYVYVSTDEQ